MNRKLDKWNLLTHHKALNLYAISIFIFYLKPMNLIASIILYYANKLKFDKQNKNYKFLYFLILNLIIIIHNKGTVKGTWTCLIYIQSFDSFIPFNKSISNSKSLILFDFWKKHQQVFIYYSTYHLVPSPTQFLSSLYVCSKFESLSYVH